MIRPLILLLLVAAGLLATAGASESRNSRAADQRAFEQAARAGWVEAFHDPGTGNWETQWFLDGEVGKVKNTTRGMELISGPEAGNHAHHMVLWTKPSFSGDVMIEYDFTRLDSSKDGVNIIYIQATGSGVGPHQADIFAWKERRRIPAMSQYFDHMHAYHISYSVGFPGSDYTRARRYMPEGKGLNGTEIPFDYGKTDLFQPGALHRMTVIKRGQALFLRVTTDGRSEYFTWENKHLPPITTGRVGFRQMFTKAGRYANVRISTVAEDNRPE
jgi:hypothetical protein